jgi:5-methylcytosine-specific restriction enzyme A
MPRRIPFHVPDRHPATSPAVLYRSQEGRREDNRFYASTLWRQLRAAFLAANPLCDECSRHGRTEVATDVHHLKERKTHPHLSLEWDNLQALCRRCHNAKRGDRC